jgi:uncharacterized protein YkwD
VARRSLSAAAGLVLVAATLRGNSAAEAAVSPWAGWTASPVAADTSGLDEVEKAVLERCGPTDAGLQATARRLLVARLAGLPMPELDAIAFAQRVSGEPHPWARAWSLSAPSLAPGVVRSAVDDWLGRGKAASRPLRRCGVAGARSATGTRLIMAVAVDALADLQPLPTHARTGQWLSVEAPLRVPAAGASVVVLGPYGPPRTVPTSLDGAVVRARFVLDSPGEFSVQVMAALREGPRPVIEASVYADVEPPAALETSPAPGEEEALLAAEAPAAAAFTQGADPLWRMLVAARRSRGLDAPTRDPRLDAVARAHAGAMAQAHDLAHDVGDGDPLERLRSAGLFPRTAGENVAHAPTLALAHRATWVSPSHRANLLRQEFTSAGVGVARDAQGEVWIAEELAGGAP